MLLYYTYNDDIKASLVERAIRTIKAKIYRYLTTRNTKRFIDDLPNLVMSYNAANHRGLGSNLSPKKVHALTSFKAIKDQWWKMYKDGVKKKKPSSSRLTVEDTIRISDSLRKSKFRPGYQIQNTQEIFKIRSIDDTQHPTVYFLKDLNEEDIEGTFYRDELTPTQLPEIFPINIISKKKIGGRIRYLVSWVGYPENFNAHVWEDEIERI